MNDNKGMNVKAGKSEKGRVMMTVLTWDMISPFLLRKT